MAIEEYVYIGRDNHNTLEVKQDGALVDFTPVISYLLTLTPLDDTADIIVDTSVLGQQGAISGDEFGVLTFELGDILTEGDCYSATFVVVDPAHPLGQVLFTEDCSGAASLLYFISCAV